MTNVIRLPPRGVLPPAVLWVETTRGGTPITSYRNSIAVLQAMKVVLKYDTFHEKAYIDFDETQLEEIKSIRGLINNDTLDILRRYISKTFPYDPGDKPLYDAMAGLSKENSYNPVLDMINAAQASRDETKNMLDTWAVTHMNCEDTELNRVLGRKFLLAAIQRVRDPGCKFDAITVFEGDEGWNKSTALQTLAGKDNFSDQSIIGADDKVVQEKLVGVWFHENAELSGMKRADVEQVKSFASRSVDRARPAWGRVTVWRPRSSVECGTTNSDKYLQSQTGNRRFWPMKVMVPIIVDKMVQDRLQLIGEAAAAEASGESIQLDEKYWVMVGEAQEERRIEDNWEDVLADIPETLEVPNHLFLPRDLEVRFRIDNDGNQTTETRYDRWGIQIIHTEESTGLQKVKTNHLTTYVLGIPMSHQNQTFLGNRVGVIMKRLGWHRNSSKKVTIGGRLENGYWRQKP